MYITREDASEVLIDTPSIYRTQFRPVAGVCHQIRVDELGNQSLISTQFTLFDKYNSLIPKN